MCASFGGNENKRVLVKMAGSIDFMSPSKEIESVQLFSRDAL